MINHATVATHLVMADDLRPFAARVLQRSGYSAPHSEDGAYVLTWASLRGIDTHGIRNLKRYYIDGIAEGTIDPKAEFAIVSETPVAARVDGGGGLGLAASCWGMRLAMDKAARSGMAFVSMSNSNHIGAAGCFPHMAVERDMIGIAMTGYFFANGNDVGIPPTYGLTPLFGTNPIAIAVPCGEEPPYVLDMATSIVPYNRVELFGELGQPLRKGWARNKDGTDTTKPAEAALLTPLGGSREQGGHKGFGLSMLVQILTGVLSGGWWKNPDRERAFGYEVEDPKSYVQQGACNFYGAIRVDQFGPVEDFKRGMDETIRIIHESDVEPGQDRIYVAGEQEHAIQEQRLREGIPLTSELAAELDDLSRTHGLPLRIRSS